MSTSKIIAVLAASAMVGLFSASAFAESIPQEEIDQFSGSSKPDVDASASKGADATVVKQEKNQLDNSMGTNVPEPSMKGGEDSARDGAGGHPRWRPLILTTIDLY